MRTHIRTMVSVLCVLALAGSALGQLAPKKDRDKEKEKKKQQQSQPTPQPGTAMPEAPAQSEPLADKVLRLEKSRDWTVQVFLVLQPTRTKTPAGPDTFIEVSDKFSFQSAAMVFPFTPTSAAHRIELDDARQPKFKSAFTLDGKAVDTQPRLVEGYVAGTKLARWEMRDIQGTKVGLDLEWLETSWETMYDEQLASTIAWPKGAWPGVAAASLKSQQYIESDDPAVKALLAKLLGGADPKSEPPAVIAKRIAGGLLPLIQSQGDAMIFNESGSLKGFQLIGAAQMATDFRGSGHDTSCLLAALYRAAGLPARVVVGYNVYSAKGGSKGLSRNAGGAGEFDSHVEFALVDPFNNKEFWVPVDIARMRKSSTRAPAFDRPWKYFGTHDELAYFLPLSFSYTPPTTVTSEAPAFWGWLTTPETVRTIQSLRVNGTHTPQRGNEAPRRNKQPEKEKQ